MVVGIAQSPKSTEMAIGGGHNGILWFGINRAIPFVTHADGILGDRRYRLFTSVCQHVYLHGVLITAMQLGYHQT